MSISAPEPSRLRGAEWRSKTASEIRNLIALVTMPSTPIAHPSPWSSIYGLHCREIPADEEIHEFLTRILAAIQKADFRSPTTSSDSTHAMETGASNLEAFRSGLRLMRKRERRRITFAEGESGTHDGSCRQG